jgi:hypothetical protein
MHSLHVINWFCHDVTHCNVSHRNVTQELCNIMDGNLRSIFRDKLKEGFHWQSVETGLTGPGTPDANFGARGVERWIEMKQTSGFKPHIRREQISWHLHRTAVDGVTFVAIRRWHNGGPRKGPPIDELWLCHGHYLATISKYNMTHTEIEWLGVWVGGPNHWDWNRIADILTAR